MGECVKEKDRLCVRETKRKEKECERKKDSVCVCKRGIERPRLSVGKIERDRE